MPGFTFRYRTSGGGPTVQKAAVKSGVTITRGDVVNLETGVLDLGATADVLLCGVAESGGGPGTIIEYIADVDAVYGVTDANARLKGATLDLAGATGAQGVATSSNKEFAVEADSTATQETLVRFNVGKHISNKAL